VASRTWRCPMPGMPLDQRISPVSGSRAYG
jgi:hypothetical protein